MTSRLQERYFALNKLIMTTVKNIFLVEDDLDDQEFFVEALSEIENTALYGIANNGEEALIKLNNYERPDLIFMDIHMPHMNGIECLTKIVQTEQIRDIPVIMLSTAIPQIEEVRSLGARGFIEKPSDNRVLKEQLETMINTDYSTNNSKANPEFTILYCPANSIR